MRNDKCWASSLEDCTPEISGEHIVSASLFPQKSILELSGMSWLKGKKKKIPIENLTSNILCTHHNSTTSSLDTEAGKFFRIFDDIAQGYHKIGRLYDNKIHRFEFNGYLIERWMLKTLINLWKSKSLDNAISFQASLEELALIVFGKTPFPGKSGLYLICKNGMPIDSRPKIEFQTILHGSSSTDAKIIGALIEIRGFALVLWLVETEMPNSTILNMGERWNDMDPGWHWKEIKLLNGLLPPRIVSLKWDQP